MNVSFSLSSFSFLLALPLLLTCGNAMPTKADTEPSSLIEKNQDADSLFEDARNLDVLEMGPVTVGIMYDEAMDRKNCFAVVSKKHFVMNVYEKQSLDTVLLASYPVCVGLNPGNKQAVGDKRTPEGGISRGFRILGISPSGDWRHDFGDGRGYILSYGAWFMRLETPPFKSIGIHGSTNNESTVPGRGSDGCIRLRDKDIIHFKNQYASVDMMVYVLTEDDDYQPFEWDARGRAQDPVPVDALRQS